METAISDCLSRFSPLSLEDLNGKAAMLERLDNKYIVQAASLQQAFAAFAGHFDILEIGNKRAFTYATRYFDDATRRGYHDHHQGRRKRCKVRMRHYVDAGFSYMEVKLKDKRSVTLKKRLRMEKSAAELDQRCVDFIESCYKELYGEGFGLALLPPISMKYQRITLVAKAAGERMTVDAGIAFELGGRICGVRPDLFIIETKSARGNGIADSILRDLHLHPTDRCSKYCIGMAALGQVKRRNRFLPALRRLQLSGPGLPGGFSGAA
jgi:hypothetical protein